MSAATSSSKPNASAPEPTFAELITPLIHDLLPDSPRVTSIIPVTAPGGPHANIRRVVLSTGESVVAKRHLFAFRAAGQPYDLLTVEQKVTACLKNAGCSVPEVLGSDPASGIVILKDVGGATLDDAIQTSSPAGRFRLATSSIDEFVRIQNAFIHQDSLTEDLVAPGGDRESVQETFAGLVDLLGPEQLRPLVSSNVTDTDLDGVASVVRRLSERPLVLGPTDYNARNIVLSDDAHVWFLEWSKVGFDWPERRAVQYLTSLGAGRPGSRPRSLIDRWTADRYAASATWTDKNSAASDLDAHHLIFHILLALRWTASQLDLPKGIRNALITPLSEDLEIGSLRRLFSQVG
jgi:hypothetical protein